jgi:hypothetical protein
VFAPSKYFPILFRKNNSSLFKKFLKDWHQLVSNMIRFIDEPQNMAPRRSVEQHSVG